MSAEANSSHIFLHTLGCSLPAIMTGYVYDGSSCPAGTSQATCGGLSCASGYKLDTTGTITVTCAADGTAFSLSGCVVDSGICIIIPLLYIQYTLRGSTGGIHL